MRRYLNYAISLFCILLLSTGLANAQANKVLDVYSGESEITATGSITLKPGFYIPAGQTVHIYTNGVLQNCVPFVANPSADQNYLSTRIFRKPGVLTDNDADQGAFSTCDVNQVIQYFDGLGRPIQTVAVQASPGFSDLIQPMSYDAFERQNKKYQPYAATSNGGAYRADALQAGAGQSAFYNSPQTGITSTAYPFSQTVFESSSLNRMQEQGAPGAEWQPVSGSTAGHTIKEVYAANIVNEVRLWVANNGSLANGGYYPANSLYKTTTKNENWTEGNLRAGTEDEYKDYQGHIVMKRVWENNDKALSTYYIYDDFDNISFVLPPGANPDVASSISQAALDNFCYQYHYDGNKRLIEKKLPGKDWDYIIYNALDQIIASQDGNQRSSGQWTFIKYDALDRLVWSGTWNNGGTVISRADLQNTVNGFTGSLWESRPTGGYLTNVAWPTSGFSGQMVINNYDDYTFPDAQYATPASASTHTKGLLTCTKTYVINSVAVLYTQFYYDDLGRNTITLKEHYLGGTTGQPNPANYDEITNTYDFSNNVTSTVRHHYTAANTSQASVIVTNSYSYDHMSRKRQTLESIVNGNATPVNPILLSQNDYNEIGQLVTKHLYSETNRAPFLQDVNYSYNERGWLNRSASGLFNFNLQYNNPDAGINAQFNGNIAEMQYTAPKSGSKAFGYTYDPLNRLTAASSTGNLLNEQIAYDPSGNITALTRTGSSAAALNYSYTDVNGNSKGNQLQSVTNNSTAFRSYGYDANGNATGDGANKSITYNVLNLPQTVAQNGSTIATYIYDGLGSKLRNIGSDGTWDYIDGIVYNNDKIQFIQTEEGRAVPNGSNYNYEYNLNDHLGNARVSFDKDPNTGNAREIQEDEYYSFGLRNPGGYNLSSNNRYLHSGKELQTDLSNQYDFGARFYDPVIGRWNVVDPITDLRPNLSPYTYCVNNPILYKDQFGLDSLNAIHYLKEVVITGSKTLAILSPLFPQLDKPLKMFTDWTDPRQDKFPAANFIDLAYNATRRNTKASVVKGELLNRVKKDPAFLAWRKQIIAQYKLSPLIYKSRQQVLKLGGNKFFSLEGDIELRLAIRGALVNANFVESNGTTIINYGIDDTFDIEPQKGRGLVYNGINGALEPFWVNVFHGNEDMKVEVRWNETITK